MFSSYWKVHVQLDLAENVHITGNKIEIRDKRLSQDWTDGKIPMTLAWQVKLELNCTNNKRGDKNSAAK